MTDDDLPMFVYRMILIVKNASQRIIESGTGLIKANLMIPDVSGRLLSVPFKVQTQ